VPAVSVRRLYGQRTPLSVWLYAAAPDHLTTHPLPLAEFLGSPVILLCPRP
jgi:hypothetical protein